MTSSVQIGETLDGRYRVERELGRGSMGIVFRGEHLALRIPIAVKILHQSLTEYPVIVERTVQEARTAAQLMSENIVRVLDVGTRSGAPYIVMELLEGETLADYIALNGPLSPSEAAEHIFQVCAGLAEAHESGIVHRDLKSENLFRVARSSRPLVKILDFGISKAKRPLKDSALQADTALGTPEYMSPEQMLAPDEVDERADIWALGVVLFELMTGNLPFDGQAISDIVKAVTETDPPRPSEQAPHLPPGLEAVVLQCLQRDPKDRPQSATELAQLLLPFIDGARSLHPSLLGVPIASAGVIGFGSPGDIGSTPSTPALAKSLRPVERIPSPQSMPAGRKAQSPVWARFSPAILVFGTAVAGAYTLWPVADERGAMDYAESSVLKQGARVLDREPAPGTPYSPGAAEPATATDPSGASYPLAGDQSTRTASPPSPRDEPSPARVSQLDDSSAALVPARKTPPPRSTTKPTSRRSGRRPAAISPKPTDSNDSASPAEASRPAASTLDLFDRSTFGGRR